MEDWYPTEADLEDRLYPSLVYFPPDEWDVENAWEAEDYRRMAELNEIDNTVEEDGDESMDAVPQ